LPRLCPDPWLRPSLPPPPFRAGVGRVRSWGQGARSRVRGGVNGRGAWAVWAAFANVHQSWEQCRCAGACGVHACVVPVCVCVDGLGACMPRARSRPEFLPMRRLGGNSLATGTRGVCVSRSGCQPAVNSPEPGHTSRNPKPRANREPKPQQGNLCAAHQPTGARFTVPALLHGACTPPCMAALHTDTPTQPQNHAPVRAGGAATCSCATWSAWGAS